jgi:penicillin-binding protein 1B
MPVKIEPEGQAASQFLRLWRRTSVLFLSYWRRPAFRIALAAVGFCLILLIGSVIFFYLKYSHIVDERIRRPIFNEPAQIYARPGRVDVGGKWTAADVISELRGAGYVASTVDGASSQGTFSEHGATLRVDPGPGSYHPGQSATLRFSHDQVDSITGPKGETLPSYELEPQLVTGLFDAKQRSKRRLLTYAEIPPMVVNAIVSVEDRRFFQHRGINYGRLVEGLLTPVLRGHRMQGGSTLTMQMARAFFLTNERSLHRKLAEMTIALVLEHRFTKEQILAIYVNQVSFGQRGSFNIDGFGEAAQAFFGKDIKNVNLPEAALLAGVVNGPSVFSPFRRPAAAIKRRNVVLQAMYDNNIPNSEPGGNPPGRHIITEEQLMAAKAAPLKLAPPDVESKDAPYYIDLVRDRLLGQYEEGDLTSGGMRVYTALDRDLQQAAAEAIDVGMKQVDALVLRQRTHKIREGKGKTATVRTEVTPGPMPQVGLIALDPHTGEVLALAGGRDYALSQLNHVVAKRPTGSIFKPFVYAAALNTAFSGDPSKAFTELTMLDATEGAFDWDGKPYSPHNFDPKDSVGQVTMRQSLMHSINTSTIRLAEMVGYDKVVALAQSAGIKDVKATPAMAIGAYDATELDMAEAYTVFANGGVRLTPAFIRSIQARTGDSLENPTHETNNVLDPRVAYIITDMLQAVMSEGTAAAVGARFNSPAAGKTGSSHDAWFAGYTSNLLCLVWVGNDDYTDIKIEGAKAAAPIWTEFMLRARKLRAYSDMQPFVPPNGVLPVPVDKVSNLPADDSCPDRYMAFFIDGTIPSATCDHPGGPSRNFLEKMFGLGGHTEPVLPPTNPNEPLIQNSLPAQPGQPQVGNPNLPTPPQQQPAPEVKQKKKGFWKRVFGGGKEQ